MEGGVTKLWINKTFIYFYNKGTLLYFTPEMLEGMDESEHNPEESLEDFSLRVTTTKELLNELCDLG